MKKLFFGSNLKMYKGIKDTAEYLQTLAEYTKNISRDEIELFIIPSFTSLPEAVKSVDQSEIRIGAQNMCWEDEGQFTGEISPCMLEEMGVGFVMIGHSERRHVFGEDDFEENRKVIAALQHDFQTLLCIGETAEEKKYGTAEETLRIQLKTGLYGVQKTMLNKLWIAYEPVWSIGVNGTPATAEYAGKIHAVIKKTLKELFGEDGKKIPVLYGGSVNPQNAEELITQQGIDGLFVGRSAWKAKEFASLIQKAKAAYEKKENTGGK